MAQLTVVNTRSTPYVVDDEGHLLDGFDTGPVDDSSPRVQRALDAGVFRKVEPPKYAPASGTSGKGDS
jgi:hypothetical protein